MSMENEESNNIRVVVSLNEIEFLNLDDVVSPQERSFLFSCVKSSPGDHPSLVLSMFYCSPCFRHKTARNSRTTLANTQERAAQC